MAFLPSVSANAGMTFNEWKVVLASCFLHILSNLQTQGEPAKILIAKHIHNKTNTETWYHFSLIRSLQEDYLLKFDMRLPEL